MLSDAPLAPRAAPAPTIGPYRPADALPAPNPQLAQQTPSFAAGDPGYQQANATYTQGLADAGSALKANREQSLIQFGDPSLANVAGLKLDPQTIAAIQASTASGNSTLAHLQQQNSDARTAILNQLAAHGLLSSGDLGYRQERQAEDYGHNVYDAQQTALGQLTTALQGYLSQKQGLQGNLGNALETAYQNYVSHPYQYTGLTAPPQTKTPATPPAPAAAPSQTLLTLARLLAHAGRQAVG